MKFKGRGGIYPERGRRTLSLSLSRKKRAVRKPVIFVILALLIFGAFFSIFSLVPPAKKAHAAGTTYYVDATGGLDGNTGLSEGQAWKTIAKVNGFAFAAGDTILFKRGETWAALLQPSVSGLSGSPITFGAYGDSAIALPKLNGAGDYGVSTTRSYLAFDSLDIRGVTFTGGGATGGTFTRCVIRSHPDNHGLSIAAGTTVASVSHCVIVDNAKYGIYVAGTLTSLRDSIVGRNGYPQIIVAATGNINYDYCHIMGNSTLASSRITVTAGGIATDGGHNVLTGNPSFTGYQAGQAYFVYSLDGHDVDHYVNVAAGLPTDVKFTAFINSADITAGEYAALAALAAAGHEIANHTVHHDGMTVTTAFSITTTNAAPTVNVNIAAKTLTLATTTPGNTVTVDWDAGTKYIADLLTAVSGKGWTITKTSEMTDVDLGALQDTAGAVAVPHTCALNATRYYDAEIGIANTQIAAMTGVTPTTLSYPWGESGAAVQNYLSAAGMLGARSVSSSQQQLTSLNLYAVRTYDWNEWVGDGTEAEIRANADYIYTYAKTFGTVASFYSHIAATISVQQIAWLVDEIRQRGGVWYTFAAAMTAIRADHTTADGKTYTKADAGASDFHLLSNSSAIGAASDGTDIGAYQYVAAVPSAPALSALSTSSIKIVVNQNGNPGIIQYAIYNETASQYVQADGTLGAGAVWQTYTQWGEAGGIVNTGLSANTSYTYKVKARGTDNVTETALSGGASRLTLANPSPGSPTIVTTPPPSSPIPTAAEIIQTVRYYTNTPYAYFAAPMGASSDSAITFDASQSFSTKGIVKYLWDFGDGTTSQEMRVEHKYEKPGRYTVTLTVTDKVGKTATKTQTVDVNPPKPTIENIKVDGDDLVFEGKAYPLTIVSLTIHSNPISADTRSGNSGDWSYTVANAKEALGAGDHTVVATDAFVLDDNTQLKSEPSKTYDFQLSLDGDKLKVEMKKTRTWQYVSLGLAIIIILGAVFVLRKRSRRSF